MAEKAAAGHLEADIRAAVEAVRAREGQFSEVTLGIGQACQSRAAHERAVTGPRSHKEQNPPTWNLALTAPHHKVPSPARTRSSGGRAQSASNAMSARSRGSAGGGSMVSTFTHVPGLEATAEGEQLQGAGPALPAPAQGRPQVEPWTHRTPTPSHTLLPSRPAGPTAGTAWPGAHSR